MHCHKPPIRSPLTLKKGTGLLYLWGSTDAKPVRETLNGLHADADEQHRRRMDLFALLREDNLPVNDSRMNDGMMQDKANTNNQLAKQ
jgi:hypothetical protein